MSPGPHPSMEDLLPENLMYDILSRLPLRTIIFCKSVCKKWRNLVSDSYFAHLHMSRLRDCLLIHHHKSIYSGSGPGFLKLVEIEKEFDHSNSPLQHTFMNLDFADVFPETIVFTVGSVNGLICLWELLGDDTYICNPITREYMILPKQQFCAESVLEVKYGFGVSMTGEYKVMRIFNSIGRRSDPWEVDVYTLGTDQWRSLGHVPCKLSSGEIYHGLFFHVHWISADDQIYAFSLDNETFQLFPTPPLEKEQKEFQFLGVLNGCLSLYSSSEDLDFTIWEMKEHGIKNSWHKKLEIKEGIIPLEDVETWFPLFFIDSLNGRNFLMVQSVEEDQLMAYCLETNTFEDPMISDDLITIKSYRPSFLKLQNFQSARVRVF